MTNAPRPLPPCCRQDRRTRDAKVPLRVLERSIFSDRQVRGWAAHHALITLQAHETPPLWHAPLVHSCAFPTLLPNLVMFIALPSAGVLDAGVCARDAQERHHGGLRGVCVQPDVSAVGAGRTLCTTSCTLCTTRCACCWQGWARASPPSGRLSRPSGSRAGPAPLASAPLCPSLHAAHEVGAHDAVAAHERRLEAPTLARLERACVRGSHGVPAPPALPLPAALTSRFTRT